MAEPAATPTPPSDSATFSPSDLIQKLSDLRAELIRLKADRTTYIRSPDVLRLYKELCQPLEAAATLRQSAQNGDESPKMKEVERMIDDNFQLMSLFYLTIGRNSEAPACYAPCITIKRLLEHLTESGNFAAKDLAPISNLLETYRENIKRDASTHPKAVIDILTTKVNECEELLEPLHRALDQISPELLGTHEKLVSLRRCIKAAEAKHKFSEAEVNQYLQQIKEIDATRKDGKFVGYDGTTPPEGQELVATLLGRCYDMASEALARKGDVPAGLKTTFDELFRIKAKLEKLELTQAWSLRETDLYEFQHKLCEIDRSRVDCKFVDEEGKAPEDGQSILLYMLRRSYAHIYTLISSSEPVSEALTPVYNQLQTVRRCLVEVQRYGIQDARELYPYSMKLASIDDQRKDGKFMIGSDIPEGQGRVISLLSECFEICQDLREALVAA